MLTIKPFETYKEAFQFARDLDHDVTMFAGTMFRIMRDRVWETGWYDDISQRHIKAPTLRDFIEQPVPRGIGRTIGWVESAFEAARHLRVLNADHAHRVRPMDESMINEALRLLQEAKTTPSLYKHPVADSPAPRRRKRTATATKYQPKQTRVRL